MNGWVVNRVTEIPYVFFVVEKCRYPIVRVLSFAHVTLSTKERYLIAAERRGL